MRSLLRLNIYLSHDAIFKQIPLKYTYAKEEEEHFN